MFHVKARYNHIGQHIKLSNEDIILFWQDYGKAAKVLSDASTLYYKGNIAGKITGTIIESLGKYALPQDFIKEVISFSGPINKTPKAYKESNNKKAGKPYVHPTDCSHCEARRCNNKRHKTYWKKEAAKKKKNN